MQNGQKPSQLLFKSLTKFGGKLWKFFETKTFGFLPNFVPFHLIHN